MIYYNPHSFYSTLLSFRGSVFPSCALHATVFAVVGTGAVELVEQDILHHDFNEISLLCGLVMSLLLTFRLTFSFNRYEEAVATVAGLQGCCRRLTAKLCAAFDAEDADSREAVFRMRRWQSLALVLSKERVRGDRLGGSADFLVTLECVGLLTADERDQLEAPLLFPAANTDESASCSERFPSKGRGALVMQWMWVELTRQMRRGSLHPQTYASLDGDVGMLSQLHNRLDAMVAQVLPFSYANFIKFVLIVYIASFPFGIAVELRWATPPVAFCAALIFLGIDRVGSVMDTPFVPTEEFGIDLEKRIRRTDKETTALVGAWLRALNRAPIAHLDLYPATARSSLPRHLRRDAVAESHDALGCHCASCQDPCGCCWCSWIARARPPGLHDRDVLTRSEGRRTHLLPRANHQSTGGGVTPRS